MNVFHCKLCSSEMVVEDDGLENLKDGLTDRQIYQLECQQCPEYGLYLEADGTTVSSEVLYVNNLRLFVKKDRKPILRKSSGSWWELGGMVSNLQQEDSELDKDIPELTPELTRHWVERLRTWSVLQ